MSPSLPVQVLLLLGSNIRPDHHMVAALGMLKAQMSIVAHSPIFQTPPIDAPGTADYLNQAVIISSRIHSDELRRQLRDIEGSLGRVRAEVENAPRTIDLDILAAADREQRIIGDWPIDPALNSLHHAAVPAAMIASGWRFPASKLTIGESVRLLGEVPDGFKQLS